MIAQASQLGIWGETGSSMSKNFSLFIG